MSRPPIFAAHGQRIMLLAARDERAWDLDQAGRLLADAVDDDPMVAHTLMRLAEDLGGWPQDPVEALAIVAQAIARGELVPFAEREPLVSGMRPVFSRADAESWDDAISLSELRRDTGDDPPRPWTPTRPQPNAFLDPHDAWLSFAVVDEQGRFAAGRYTCTIDGDAHQGPLGAAAQEFRGLSTSARARLAIDDLGFVPTALGYDGPAPVPTRPVEPSDPGSVSPAAGQLTLEVVDEHGTPIRGRYCVTDGDREHRGDLGGVVEIDAPVAPRLGLQLDFSHGPGHRDG